MSMAALPPVSDGLHGLGPVVVMGASGCGKSSVGRLLAAYMGCSFVEGDSFHSRENVQKMSSGIALGDDDRWPWLDALGEVMSANGDRVVSCSALKMVYRDRLRAAAGRPITFVFLQGPRTMLSARLGERKDHYMPASLLDSQLAELEVPVHESDVVTIEILQPIERIVGIAMTTLAARHQRAASNNLIRGGQP